MSETKDIRNDKGELVAIARESCETFQIQPEKCSCGKILTEEEIKYYGHSCNDCEYKFVEAMESERRDPQPEEEPFDFELAEIYTKQLEEVDAESMASISGGAASEIASLLRDAVKRLKGE